MSWVFDVSTNEFSKSGKIYCHSTKGTLPVGFYTIGYAKSNEHLGELFMTLYPKGGDNSADVKPFYLTGDTDEADCLVIPRIVRLRLAMSEDRILEIVED
jgi:hypothetical protein